MHGLIKHVKSNSFTNSSSKAPLSTPYYFTYLTIFYSLYKFSYLLLTKAKNAVYLDKFNSFFNNNLIIISKSKDNIDKDKNILN